MYFPRAIEVLVTLSTFEGTTMQRKGIVNGINQAGKVGEGYDQPAPRREPENIISACVMAVLNAFGSFVSPIKENKKRR